MILVAAVTGVDDEIPFMESVLFAIVATIAAIAALFLTVYLTYRGKRIVVCPETNEPVGAEVNALLAAATGFPDRPRFVISACTRWPERKDCDQACLTQIDDSPQGTLVTNIVTKWYSARSCAYCGKPVGDIGGAVHPALRSADGSLREWKDIPLEDLTEALSGSVAVCPPCELAEDFRQRFPELVTDRMETPLRNRAIH